MDARPPSGSRPVRVWDIGTRGFHWLLVLLIAAAWQTYAADLMTWHKRAGEAVAALLVFRLYWGVVGPETARFSNFLKGPGAAWRELRAGHRPGVGHSPLGGWSIAAILALLAAAVGLGLFAVSRDGLESGPLADFVRPGQGELARRLHALAFDALLGLAALHLAAIAAYAALGDNLIGPMLTGRKQLARTTPDPASAPAWSLALGVGLAVATYLALRSLDAA